MKSAASHLSTETLDRAVEAGAVVRRLREDYGLTQSIIAEATGASARSVRNWEQTSAIRPHNDERLRDLREVVLILRETLTARGVGQWLTARNRILHGRRPIDLLAEGNPKDVREAATAYVEGAYV
jgi:transcriptional regulator with XRE-family HTH domain